MPELAQARIGLRRQRPYVFVMLSSEYPIRRSQSLEKAQGRPLESTQKRHPLRVPRAQTETEYEEEEQQAQWADFGPASALPARDRSEQRLVSVTAGSCEAPFVANFRTQAVVVGHCEGVDCSAVAGKTADELTAATPDSQ